MSPEEIRVRLIEAAARIPTPHVDGYAAGVLETAAKWYDYVQGYDAVQKISGSRTLGLPKKGP